MPKFEKPALIPSVFASGGDANDIPASNDGTAGLASFLLGFPEITERPIANGGIPPNRLDFNGIVKFITAFLGYAQQGGMFDYDESQDYGENALIVYNDTYYKCIKENGPDTTDGVKAPTDKDHWSLLVPDDIVAAVKAASGQLTVTKKDGTQETFPIGRVTDVTETGGVVTVTKEDGSKSTFKVVTSVNSDGGTGGNVTVSSGVVAGNVSNVNSWWVKLGGTIPLIIQGGRYFESQSETDYRYLPISWAHGRLGGYGSCIPYHTTDQTDYSSAWCVFATETAFTIGAGQSNYVGAATMPLICFGY